MAAPRNRRSRANREKLSTTVAPETLSFLHELVEQGEAQNLAEALDVLVRRQLEEERRTELERRTAEYYANMSEEEAAEERLWGQFALGEIAGMEQP